MVASWSWISWRGREAGGGGAPRRLIAALRVRPRKWRWWRPSRVSARRAASVSRIATSRRWRWIAPRLATLHIHQRRRVGGAPAGDRDEGVTLVELGDLGGGEAVGVAVLVADRRA